MDNVVELPSEGLSNSYKEWRGINARTMAFFDVSTRTVSGKDLTISFPYANGRTKIRSLSIKKYYADGAATKNTGWLFGSDKFPAASSPAITICEGEADALATYQMFGSKYPVVSVWSAGSARKDCSHDFEYLNSFEKIYLCFDNDDAGKEALQKVASLFDFNKVYHVKLTRKDPLEYLENNDKDSFIKAWWGARRFLPEGVISTFDEFDKIIDEDGTKESTPYPFGKLQEMTYGIRTGELNLFTAQEGIGKTEVFRSLEYNLLRNTTAKVGIIHLEEGKGRILKGLAGYQLRQPVHLPDTQVSNDEIKKALRTLSGTDERMHIYTHFGSDDPDVILNTIRFMAGSCECKYIFLDHITLVVTGLQGDDERRQLDYISTQLAMMVEDLDFTLFLVSHVNDDGLTRGSRNISKVCDLHVHLDRDITAPTQEMRSLTYLTVRKNRYAGKTGPAGKLRFNSETFMLDEEMEMPE